MRLKVTPQKSNLLTKIVRYICKQLKPETMYFNHKSDCRSVNPEPFLHKPNLFSFKSKKNLNIIISNFSIHTMETETGDLSIFSSSDAEISQLDLEIGKNILEEEEAVEKITFSS